MAVYGIGKNNKLGREFNQLLRSKFTEHDRKTPTYQDKSIKGIIRGEVKDFQIHTEGNRFKSIERPVAVLSGELTKISGADGRDIDFSDENRPTYEMKQELNDRQIKRFVDAGMYRNERFESLMRKVSQNMSFEFDGEVNVREFDVGAAYPESQLGTVCLVDDVGKVFFDHDGDIYTSIDDVFEEASYLLSDLESGHASESDFDFDSTFGSQQDVPAYMRDRESEELRIARPDEGFVSIDDNFDVDLESDGREEEDFIIERPEEIMIDPDEELDRIFGQSDEDELIAQMQRGNESIDRSFDDSMSDLDHLEQEADDLDIADMTFEEFLMQEDDDLSSEQKNKKRQRQQEHYDDLGL